MEKHEIDKFLKQVRERKKAILFSDPKIKYDSHKYRTLNSDRSPIQIWGVKKQSKLPQVIDPSIDSLQGDNEMDLYPYPSHAKLDIGNRRHS